MLRKHVERLIGSLMRFCSLLTISNTFAARVNAGDNLAFVPKGDTDPKHILSGEIAPVAQNVFPT
jgi:hypothetical protein